MNNPELQKELLEKIKPGTKPSDLKKPSKKPTKKPVSPPSISIEDKGYSSEEKPLEPIISQNQKNPSSHYILDLETQIKSLQKQLQIYQDFKNADLKIKEQLKNQLAEKDKSIIELQQKNSELNQIIQDLKTKQNPTENVNPEPIKTFLCSDCQQTKPASELSRQFSTFSFCRPCSQKARQQATKEKQPPQPQPSLFTCIACEQEKQEIPSYKKVDIPYNLNLIKGQTYPVCSSCSPHIKEYNEHENQEFSIGED